MEEALTPGTSSEARMDVRFSDTAQALSLSREDDYPPVFATSRMVALMDYFYGVVGLSYKAKFATRPEARIGSDELWDRVEGALRAALWVVKQPPGLYNMQHVLGLQD